MTKLLYLTDSYLYTSSADIIEIWSNEFWDYIILDQTIFYPQGWGQPSDTGIIYSESWKFGVKMCRLSENWVVYHYGNFTEWDFIKWEQVNMKIDLEKRVFNMRNHSAGHLVDIAMEKCGYTSLEASKGFHFPEGSYVEYHGELPEEIEQMKEKINITLQELSQKNIPIWVNYKWLWTLETPAGKTPRYVEFEWYKWCGCGGTHVKNSSEIGKVSIRKMKWKKGVLRVSYEITQ